MRIWWNMLLTQIMFTPMPQVVNESSINFNYVFMLSLNSRTKLVRFAIIKSPHCQYRAKYTDSSRWTRSSSSRIDNWWSEPCTRDRSRRRTADHAARFRTSSTGLSYFWKLGLTRPHKLFYYSGLPKKISNIIVFWFFFNFFDFSKIILVYSPFWFFFNF